MQRMAGLPPGVRMLASSNLPPLAWSQLPKGCSRQHGGRLQGLEPYSAATTGRAAGQPRSTATSTSTCRAVATAAAPSSLAEDIQDRELHVEASESYLAYAMSVIVGRALPDVRDGLKPVHRRLLYAMHDLGLTANKPFRKCARVVGEVLGKYHPHGDGAVYDALVRLAQDFSMRDPLISGHGNFGSLDDDPAAAMRYTECRLRPLSVDALLSELHLGTVDWAPTFDAAQDEPCVLPAKLPMLLINGGSGIAVGIATRIPPHNMREVVDGLVAMIHKPDISSTELMQYIPAPDFPTGGSVVVSDALTEAYTTGKGAVTIRAKIDVEGEDDGSSDAEAVASTSRPSKSRASATKGRPGRTQLVITEVPYQTSKAELVQKIAELVESKELEGVADVRDESDREGVRVVVELKKGVSSQRVLSQLLAGTRLQSKFPCNMVALRGSTPDTMTLRDMLKHFLDFRCDVVVRRSRFQCSKAQQRLHLVEGFLAAMASMDAVVQAIRSAPDGASAREALVSQFSLSAAQADGVLGLTLRRLTALERGSLEEERKELVAQIQELQALMADPALVLSVVEREAREMADKHGTPRRSVIVDQRQEQGLFKAGAAADAEPAGSGRACVVTLSTKGFLYRVAAEAGQGKSSKGTKYLPAFRDGDAPLHTVGVRESDTLLLVTAAGKVFSVKADQVPEGTGKTSSASIAKVLGKDSNVPAVALVPLTAAARKLLAAAREAESVAATAAAAAGDGNGEKVAGAGEAEAASASGQGIGEGSGAGAATAAAGTAGSQQAASTSSSDPGLRLLLVTERGAVLLVPVTPKFLKINKLGITACKATTDPIRTATLCHKSDVVLLAASNGYVGMFAANNFGTRPRQALKLGEGASVAAVCAFPATALEARPDPAPSTGSSKQTAAALATSQCPTEVLLVNESGKAKRVALSDFKLTKGSGSGLQSMPTRGSSSEGPDCLVGVTLVASGSEVVVGTAGGQGLRVLAEQMPVKKRDLAADRGLQAKLAKGDKVSTVVLLANPLQP